MRKNRKGCLGKISKTFRHKVPFITLSIWIAYYILQRMHSAKLLKAVQTKTPGFVILSLEGQFCGAYCIEDYCMSKRWEKVMSRDSPVHLIGIEIGTGKVIQNSDTLGSENH